MSYSSEVKEELARVFPTRRCCRKSELLGLIKASGSLRIQKDCTSLDIDAEGSLIARKAFLLIKHLYGVQAQILVRRRNGPRRQNNYMVRIIEPLVVQSILQDIDVKGTGDVPQDVNDANGQRCCRRGFLRGFFLGAGFLSPPGKGHHLEMAVTDQISSANIISMLSLFGIGAKCSIRKSGMAVYLKHGGDIADLLNVMGAHNALLSYENVRALKTMKSRVNRLVNMETANLTKVARAASQQVADIRFIQKVIGLSALPESLQEVARLRLEHEHATLAEIGKMTLQNVGKSGINHRMRKISEIARELRERHGAGS